MRQVRVRWEEVTVAAQSRWSAVKCCICVSGIALLFSLIWQISMSGTIKSMFLFLRSKGHISYKSTLLQDCSRYEHFRPRKLPLRLGFRFVENKFSLGTIWAASLDVQDGLNKCLVPHPTAQFGRMSLNLKKQPFLLKATLPPSAMLD